MTTDKGGRNNIRGSPMISNVQFGNRYSKYNALLDSGSDVSLLDSSVFRKIPAKNIIKFWKDRTTPLNSASGHGIKSVGKASVMMSINGERYTVNFILTQGFRFDVLLGSDFIYEQKAKLDFEQNTMIIGKKVILLKCKHELQRCSLLEVTTTQDIAPYTITHIEVRPRSKSYCQGQGTCMITPLSNCDLFIDEPGLVSPCVTVSKQSSSTYALPLVNNTGSVYKVKKKHVVAIIEQLDPADVNSLNNSYADYKSLGLEPQPIDTQVKRSSNFDVQRSPVERSNDFELRHTQVEGLLHVNHIEHNTPHNIEDSSPYNIGLSTNTQECQSLINLIDRHNHLFVSDVRQLTQTNVLQATFNTGNSQPIKQRPYKNPLALQAKLDEQINDMLEAGIVSPSSSPWSSPIVIVPKKDGTQRICIDYRKLNKTLVKDSYPLPRIEDIFATLGKAKFFSTLDLKSGYHQISVAPEHREKTAFCTRNALYHFNRLPFGIASAHSIFQRMISRVLHGIEGHHAMAYLGDILIFSKTFEEHLKHLEDVFTRLKTANLSLNQKKCHFMKSEIEYLGHIVSPDGIRPNPEKVRSIQTLDPPTTVKGVRSFLGLAGYYRNFIPQFSAIARPLTKLTRKNERFIWDDDTQQAFEYLKKKLTEAPILGYPDVNRPYSLYTDASDYSVGGILTQDTPEGEKVICYVSHQLTTSRMHYPVIEKECFAIIYCLTKLRQYLLGADVTVYTDHAPLKSLFTAEMKNTRVQRWAILLDEYQVKIKYRQGIHNGRADMLSRIRIKPTADEIKESNEIIAIEEDQNKVRMYEDILFDKDINMILSQRRDDYCKRIRRQLRDQVEKVIAEYTVQDNLLYRIGKENRFETEPFLQLVIPLELKNIILEGYHDCLGGGHVGIEKTYQKIRSRYFWKHCYKDVVDYVTMCETCQRRTLRRRQAELQEHVTAQYPMEIIGIDTVGPFVTSENGNNYIVTVIDWYTSWVEAYPVPNKEANTIAKVLMERFIPQHSCPRQMISDRGSEYVNAAIDLLSTKMKIKRSITTPYHPAGNGKTERCHRFLNDILAKGVQGKLHSEWEDVLPAALFAMRTCVNDSSKYTPYMLMYGRDPTLPLDTLLEPRRRYYGEDYVPTMLQRLHTAFTHVADNTKRARESIKQQADKHARQRLFQVGDPVFLHDPVIKPGEMKKLASPWKSHYRIIEMASPVSALIRSQKDGTSKIVHVNNLRFANINRDWDFDELSSDEEDTFPEQNTRRKAAPQRQQPQRHQPHRQVKRSMHANVGLSGGYSEDSSEEDTDSDSSAEAKDDSAEQRGKPVLAPLGPKEEKPEDIVQHMKNEEITQPAKPEERREQVKPEEMVTDPIPDADRDQLPQEAIGEKDNTPEDMVADTSTGAEGDQLPPEAIVPKKAPSEVVMKDPSTRDIPKTSRRKESSERPTTSRQTGKLGPSKRTEGKRYNLRSRPYDRTDHSSSDDDTIVDELERVKLTKVEQQTDHDTEGAAAPSSRRDSESTIIYDPNEVADDSHGRTGSTKRERTESTESCYDSDDPIHAMKTARIDDSEDEDESEDGNHPTDIISVSQGPQPFEAYTTSADFGIFELCSDIPVNIDDIIEASESSSDDEY